MIVRSRSWEWLRRLCARLNVDLVLVNAQGTVVPFFDESDATAGTGVRLLESQSPSVQAAIAAVLGGQPTRSLIADGVPMVCVAVRAGASESGVLVLTRTSTAASRAETGRAELEIISQWLSPAVAAHLQSTVAAADEGFTRVASLLAVLDGAAVNASEREIMQAFADALAIWHDLELTAYVETPGGAFVRDVMLPGADLAALPAEIVPDHLPPDLASSTLMRVEADRLGVAPADGVFLFRLDSADRPSWLLLMRTVSSAVPDDTHLAVYVRLLEQSLAAMTSHTVTSISGVVARVLFEQEGDPATIAAAALAELRNRLKLDAAHVVVANDNVPVVQAGALAADPVDDASRVVTVLPVTDRWSIELSVSRRRGQHISPLDRRVVGAAAAVFQHWARQVIREGSRVPDRRTSSRRFDDVLDRFARQALERGVAVSVIVMTLTDSGGDGGATQKKVADIRSQLRPSDIVGLLGEREIGVLLHETSDEQARHVARRVAAVVEGAGGARNVATIGVATRLPGSEASAAAGVVQEARAHALQRNVA